jgi:hypothetical protein
MPILEWCQYVTRQGEACAGIATHACHRCGIRLCNACACVNKHEHARERARQRYCFDCHQIVEAAGLAGPSKFADVQPISLDAYSVDMPVRRRGPLKW